MVLNSLSNASKSSRVETLSPVTPTASAEGVWIQVRCPLEAQW